MSLTLQHKRAALAGQCNPAAAPAPADGSAKPMTPARRRQQRTGLQNQQSRYALYQASLEEDLRQLRERQGTAAKAELKCALLPKYLDYIAEYRAAVVADPAASHGNGVLVHGMIWLFDTGQIDAGLDLADFAIADGQHMPERFLRATIETFVADEVFDWAEDQNNTGHTPEPYFGALLQRIDAGGWDVNNAIKAKYYKLAGEMAFAAADYSAAVEQLNRAAACGGMVKTLRARAQKKLAAVSDSTADSETDSDTG